VLLDARAGNECHKGERRALEFLKQAGTSTVGPIGQRDGGADTGRRPPPPAKAIAIDSDLRATLRGWSLQLRGNNLK
jgi:hypothetical protein